MTRWRLDGAPVDAAIEIERFASFDHPTRRFIAYAMGFVPELVAFIGDHATHAGNEPAPFKVTDEEAAERTAAYSALPLLRSCRATGAEGRRERRQNFGALLGMAYGERVERFVESFR